MYTLSNTPALLDQISHACTYNIYQYIIYNIIICLLRTQYHTRKRTACMLYIQVLVQLSILNFRKIRQVLRKGGSDILKNPPLPQGSYARVYNKNQGSSKDTIVLFLVRILPMGRILGFLLVVGLVLFSRVGPPNRMANLFERKIDGEPFLNS